MKIHFVTFDLILKLNRFLFQTKSCLLFGRLIDVSFEVRRIWWTTFRGMSSTSVFVFFQSKSVIFRFYFLFEKVNPNVGKSNTSLSTSNRKKNNFFSQRNTCVIQVTFETKDHNISTLTEKQNIHSQLVLCFSIKSNLATLLKKTLSQKHLFLN